MILLKNLNNLFQHGIKCFKTLLLFLVMGLFVACGNSEAKKLPQPIEPVERDTTITPANAYSNLFFDSLALEKMMLQRALPDTQVQRLRNFYNGRNYQYAWFTDTGFSEQVPIYWSVQSQYIAYSGDSSLYNPFLDSLVRTGDSTKSMFPLKDSVRLSAEVQFTTHFITYASRAYQGNINIDEEDLGWFIPRKRINTVALLDSLVQNRGQNLEAYAPVNSQYQKLKGHLLRYYELQRAGGWPTIVADKKKYQPGDSAKVMVAIKRRLATLGDYTVPDTGYVYNDSLQTAVKRFQKRHGLVEDGIIGGNTFKYLNQPLEDRIRQLLVNMERMRWMPQQGDSTYILVNIPQYRLTVFEGGKPSFGMNIVVGTSQNRTVVFTGNLKHVVFAPYWNVPPGIMKNEILPAINRNPNYLAQHHMEWNGNYVRQKPGPWNALGKVKFLFPNNFHIYLHDTPAKGLFNQQKRAFSHGCIRIEDPQRMAEWVLRDQPEWTTERILQAMNGSEEKYVTVDRDIPVVIGYFTAWVSANGSLNFREDVYGHDAKLAQRLFER